MPHRSLQTPHSLRLKKNQNRLIFCGEQRNGRTYGNKWCFYPNASRQRFRFLWLRVCRPIYWGNYFNHLFLNLYIQSRNTSHFTSLLHFPLNLLPFLLSFTHFIFLSSHSSSNSTPIYPVRLDGHESFNIRSWSLLLLQRCYLLLGT